MLLYLDNFSGHSKIPLEQITVKFLPPNTTAASQVWFERFTVGKHSLLADGSGDHPELEGALSPLPPPRTDRRFRLKDRLQDGPSQSSTVSAKIVVGREAGDTRQLFQEGWVCEERGGGFLFIGDGPDPGI